MPSPLNHCRTNYADAAHGPNRRKCDRHECTPEHPRCLIAAVAVDPWLVPVRNISASGINFRLARRLDPGTVVTVKLFNTVRQFECTVPVRVVYILQHADGDYLIGGAFERELSESEVQGLL
jgi:hypothetical protein